MLHLERPELERFLENPYNIIGIFTQCNFLLSFDFQCPPANLPLPSNTTVICDQNDTAYIEHKKDCDLILQDRLGHKLRARIGIVWSRNTIR